MIFEYLGRWGLRAAAGTSFSCERIFGRGAARLVRLPGVLLHIGRTLVSIGAAALEIGSVTLHYSNIALPFVGL